MGRLTLGLILCFTLVAVFARLIIENILIRDQIVPDVIPVPPKEVLEVNYPNSVKADFGNELTPTQVKDQPCIKWPYNPMSHYTLAMIDPDAPSHADPNWREFLHWLVVNISGRDVKNGMPIAEYVGSGPPHKTGLHRYVFLVYRQRTKMIFNETYISNRSSEGRPQFSIHKFATKYGLGDPVAGNFFRAQYDDYVPTVHKQLESN